MADDTAIEPRAHTMRGQRFVNRLMRAMLRTPLLCRLLGRRLITVYVVGRKTGRRYTVPVAYTGQEDTLLIGSPFGWIRNLRGSEPVEVRLKGRRVRVDVGYLADEPAVTEAFATMARDNRNFATFNRIGFDAAGEPLASDLHLAWAAGARAARLTPNGP
jgi:deazaflavin-dependent oxidoreductase (nitroreductase family)